MIWEKELRVGKGREEFLRRRKRGCPFRKIQCTLDRRFRAEEGDAPVLGKKALIVKRRKRPIS